MTNSPGFFLTVEGIEGVGKSTAVKFIHDYFINQNKEIVLTREPGGTLIAEHIRKLVLNPVYDEIMLPETELLLMFACRTQHIYHIIRPALQAGKCVISDRFLDATFAYQGGGRGVDLSQIHLLSEWLVNGLLPDLTILLDAPPEIGLMRAKHRGPHDRIEKETLAFHQRVRDGYLQRAQDEPQRFRLIDATQPLHEVQKALKEILDNFSL